MLRTLSLVLLLANVLLLAALSGVFDPAGNQLGEREPERLQRQHRPGLVRVLDPQAASAALAAASAASTQVAAAASSAQDLACLEAGPFSATDAAAAERTLREAGLAPSAWQAQRRDSGAAFMIYMGRYADRETLQRKLAELKRLKLDGEDLQHMPELQPGISLGRFDNQDSASAAMAQMAQRGLRTARVITLRQAQSQTLLRLPAADATLRARLAGLQLPNGPGFLPCAALPVAPGAASAASTASATSAPAAAAAAVAAPPKASAPAAGASGTAAAARPVPPVPPVPTEAAARVPAAASAVAGAATRSALARAASAAAAEAALSASR